LESTPADRRISGRSLVRPAFGATHEAMRWYPGRLDALRAERVFESIAGRDERLDEWSGRRARRARDLDAGTVPLQDGRDSGGDGVEMSVDVNFRARPRAGHGAKPVTESAVAERGRWLRSFELGPGVAGR
jgi:hypothetical protein